MVGPDNQSSINQRHWWSLVVSLHKTAAAVTLFAYDYLLTFEKEVGHSHSDWSSYEWSLVIQRKVLWPAKWSWGKILFCIVCEYHHFKSIQYFISSVNARLQNRYVALVNVGLDSISKLGSASPTQINDCCFNNMCVAVFVVPNPSIPVSQRILIRLTQ